MNYLPKTIFLLWTVAFLAPIAAYAEKTTDRTIRSVFFKRPADIAETSVLVHAGGSIQISLPAMNLSDPTKLPAGDLILYVLPKPPELGSPIPAGAPLVKIPASWTQALLLFFPDPENKIFPVRVLAFDGSIGSFKPGEMLCLNLSNAAVGGSLGDTKFRINSGRSAILKASIREAGDYPVVVDCLLKGEASTRPLCRTVWRHDPEARQILFIVNADDRLVPRIWSVVENINPPTVVKK